MSKDSDKMASFGNFNENLKELLFNDLEEAKNIIAESGLDAEKTIEDGLKLVKKLQFIAKANLNQANDKFLIEEAFMRLKALIKEKADISGQQLKELLVKKAPAFQFRNLENLGDQELKEILQEVDLIKLMEDIETEKNK